MSLIDFVNDRAVLMRGTVPRNTNPRASRLLILQAVPPVFHQAADGTISPSIITLSATLFGIPGAVTWSADGATLSGGVDNVRTIAAADMVADSISVAVQITYQGEIYAATQLIQKVRDGTNGTSTAGIRGNVDITVLTEGGSWSDSEAVAGLAAAGYGAPQERDLVTLYKADGSFSKQRVYTSGAWTDIAAYINGNLLVKGSVLADAIAVTNLAAIVANLGSVNLGAGGNLKTSNSDGWGYWPAAGAGTIAYFGPEGMQIGNYNDNRFIHIYANGNIFTPNFSIVGGVPSISNAQISSPTINTPTINTPNISAITGNGSGSNLTALITSNGGTTYTMGSRTAVGAGGSAGYKYSWSLDGDVAETSTSSGIRITSDSTFGTVTLASRGATGDSWSVTARCTITDLGSGLSGFAEFTATHTHT